MPGRPYPPCDVPRDVTPSKLFLDRRGFLRAAAAAGLTAGLSACGRESEQGGPAITGPDPRIAPPRAWPEDFSFARNESFRIPRGVGEKITPRETAARHNNFYEFLPGRGGDVWPDTHDFVIEPWTLRVSGACEEPLTLSLDDLQAFEHEERLYHFRCVERWAMNVPWVGFPLHRLLARARPTSAAKFVRFVSANRPDQMPGLGDRAAKRYDWPYHEALRIDEAMHDLVLLVTGAYGEPLPKQHGAPVRLIVPWKYGYKSAKSLVSIELTEEQPPTFWGTAHPHEYGFLSNVNPLVPHPRWSQAKSYWVARESKQFDTPMFNGYERYVASLYPDEPRTLQPPLRRGQLAR